MKRSYNYLSMAFALASIGFGASAASEDYIQPADQFAAALANVSSSPSFVLITAIDGRTNESRTGCILALFLIGAIVREEGLPLAERSSRDKAREIALSQPDHVYRFSKPEALANLDLWTARDALGPARYAEACKIIRAGHPAFIADRSGQIREGNPFP